MEKGLDITIRGGSEWWISFHYLYLSKTYLDLGDPQNSRSFIEEALKLSQKNSEKHFEGASWTWLGRILGKTDPSQSDKAESMFQEMGMDYWLAKTQEVMRRL